MIKGKQGPGIHLGWDIVIPVSVLHDYASFWFYAMATPGELEGCGPSKKMMFLAAKAQSPGCKPCKKSSQPLLKPMILTLAEIRERAK